LNYIQHFLKHSVQMLVPLIHLDAHCPAHTAGSMAQSKICAGSPFESSWESFWVPRIPPTRLFTKESGRWPRRFGMGMGRDETVRKRAMMKLRNRILSSLLLSDGVSVMRRKSGGKVLVDVE
jgi:hypothetical protein